MTIYPSEKPYVFYHITYSGDKMPPNYFGSTDIYQIQKGYMGSVKSKKYKDIWKQELKKHPELFHMEVISYHYTRQEALDKELKIQKIFNVVVSDLFVNMSYARENGYFGARLTGKDNPSYGMKRSDAYKTKISERMKNMWKDQNSSYNKEQRSKKLSNSLKQKWKDMESGFHSIDTATRSDNMKRSHADKSSGFNTKEYFKKREYFKTQEFSEKMSEVRNTDEMKQLQSKITKSMWSDPNHKIHSLETNEKRRLSTISSHNTLEYKEKMFEMNAKLYLITDPNGHEYKIKGLSGFCKENDLTRSAMIRVYQGKQKSHKGWMCQKL